MLPLKLGLGPAEGADEQKPPCEEGGKVAVALQEGKSGGKKATAVLALRRSFSAFRCCCPLHVHRLEALLTSLKLTLLSNC